VRRDQLQRFLTIVTVVFAVIGYALYLFCFANTQEQVAHESKPVTIKETIDTVRQNRPLLILCVSNMVYLTGIFGLQVAQAYFATYILRERLHRLHRDRVFPARPAAAVLSDRRFA
jgi:glucuronide carrier protein